MKTITLELFKFNELSEAAQQKAINEHRNSIDDVLWFFSDDIAEQLKEENITLSKRGLQYSLNYCQGDGLSFAGEFDVLKMVKLALPNLSAKRQDIINHCIYKIYSTGNTGRRYCYALKIDIDFEYNHSNWDEHRYTNLSLLCQKVAEFTENYYIDLCDKFKKQGYDEIDYQYSDEGIKETIIDNDYEFTIDGNRY